MRAFLASFLIFAAVGLFFAASAADNGQSGSDSPGSSLQAPSSHAPLELFGIGPEMFGDRGVAWVKNLAAVVKEAVAELGFITAAVLLAIQNIKQKTSIKDRLDRQREDINHVAAATGVVTPSAVAAPITP